MAKFKLVVSKDQKSYTLIVSADSSFLAKEKAHKEWYSILSLEDISWEAIEWNHFYFEAIKDWKFKKWKVVWKDIFKIYLKLRMGLWYEIKIIHPVSDSALSDDEKKKIASELNTQYELYLRENNLKWKDYSKNSNKSQSEDRKFDSFYMKKDLEETYKLINFVLSKLQNIIENRDFYDLTLDDTDNLRKICNSIIKLKKSTNISRIREVGETALLKIWKIELRSIERDRNEESLKFLSQTNKLLKQIWSKKQILEKSKDIKYMFMCFFFKLETFFSNLKKDKAKEKKENVVDKKSYLYLKTLVLLGRYKKRLYENNKYFLKNIFFILFPFWKNKELKDSILMRRRVIKQNIFLLEAKKSWKGYSYTKIVKWYKKLLGWIFLFFSYIKSFIFLLVFLYSLAFLVFFNFSYYSLFSFSFNYNWLFYFLIAMFVYILITASRWFMSLLINSFLLFSITIFSMVNF